MTGHSLYKMEFTKKATGANQHQSRGEMFCRGQSSCLFPKPCFLTDRYVNVYTRNFGYRGGADDWVWSSSMDLWSSSTCFSTRVGALCSDGVPWTQGPRRPAPRTDVPIAWEEKIGSFVIFLIIVTPLDFVPGEGSHITMEHTQSVSIYDVLTCLLASDLRCVKHYCRGKLWVSTERWQAIWIEMLCSMRFQASNVNV